MLPRTEPVTVPGGFVPVNTVPLQLLSDEKLLLSIDGAIDFGWLPANA